MKDPKVVKPTNNKMILHNFGDKWNKQPNVPFLPDFFVHLMGHMYKHIIHTHTPHTHNP